MLNVTLRKILLRLSFRRDSKQLTIHWNVNQSLQMLKIHRYGSSHVLPDIAIQQWATGQSSCLKANLSNTMAIPSLTLASETSSTESPTKLRSQQTKLPSSVKAWPSSRLRPTKSISRNKTLIKSCAMKSNISTKPCRWNLQENLKLKLNWP